MRRQLTPGLISSLPAGRIAALALFRQAAKLDFEGTLKRSRFAALWARESSPSRLVFKKSEFLQYNRPKHIAPANRLAFPEFLKPRSNSKTRSSAFFRPARLRC